MGRRTGSADLPLHGGRVPAWLAGRMSRLGRVVVEAIALHYGPKEVLRRLAHPFWFQSLGAVMGMDWHSSGITTSVVGALKRGLQPVAGELGIHVCGGRGRHSRRTPDELLALGERVGVDGQGLVQASRLVAKVDSAAIHDGFAIYLHAFVVDDDGDWAVIQQGMNTVVGQARRYHWLSEGLESFVEAPHQGIEGPSTGTIVNLTDRRAGPARAAQLELIQAGPDRTVQALARIRRPEPASVPRTELLPHLQLPAHHEVTANDVVLRRLHGALAAAADAGPRDFGELLLTPGVGQRTVEALAQVAEVVHGTPCRFSDPARFSYAHGGKDGHPFPVPLKVYDETLRVLDRAVQSAKLGNAERLSALERLDEQARRLERVAQREPFETIIARQRALSAGFGGRTAGGPAPRPGTRPPRKASRQQLGLPLGRAPRSGR